LTNKNKLLCIGHRGAMGHAPENTIASIEKALEMGAPCIEVDVYLVDGRLVVFHDERLERTTNGCGYLCDQTFGDLRKLNAGGGQKIPTLQEVFDVVDQRAGVNIELKGTGTVHPAARFISFLRERKWSDELLLVSSFNHRKLKALRQLDDRIKIGALTKERPADGAAFASALGAYSVHLSLESVDRRFVDDAHRRGLRVFVFTVNRPEDIARMEALGVDGVFTNYPQRVLDRLPDKDIEIGWR